MELALASFDSISEVNMDYTITIYLNQYWRDERLVFSNNKEASMILTGDFAERIWVPDTFFANDKDSYLHDVTEKNKMLRLYGDGSIVYGMRFTTTLACMMDLHYYPLDEQNCTVEIESYGYPMQDVIMRWRNVTGKLKEGAVHGVESIQIPQFTIVEHDVISLVESLATGDYQRLSLSFVLKRNIGYFIFQTYLPSILIVMLSWVSFWINHEATSARVALGITTVLTMTTINTGVRSSLPRISYVKAIDIYLVMCFVFVFAALLEYAAVNYTYWGARAKRKARRFKQLAQQDDEANSQNSRPGPSQVNAVQCSPILGLRKRTVDLSAANNQSTGAAASTQYYAAPRVTDPLPRFTYPTSSKRRNEARRRRILAQLRRRARELRQKIPSVTDVNKIDKYSRLVFPSLFLVFNLCYWIFYLMQ